jgi:hypothetical protein
MKASNLGGDNMMRRNLLTSVALVLLVVSGCSSSDPTTTDEYAALEQELALAEARLVETTTELDTLSQQIANAIGRSDKTAATVESLAEIIKDPDSFGTQSEVLDLLMTMATDDTVMDDTAFGAVAMRTAWANTLWGSGATIDTSVTWMCDDGSLAGSLWTWRGQARNGEPFELIGVNLDEYNDEGKITYSLIDWPYEGAFVREAFARGTGSKTDSE